MRRRILSLMLVALAVLALAGSAFAQTAQFGRTDAIMGFASSQGVQPAGSGTFMPMVTTTDESANTIGLALGPYVEDLDAWFMHEFGFRPSMPTHFLLFSNEEDVVRAAESLRGSMLSPEDRNLVLSRPAHLMMAMQPAHGLQPGHWAILVNTDVNAATQTFMDINSLYETQTGIMPVRDVTQEDGMRLIQHSMAWSYTMLMESEEVGLGGPEWYRVGLADVVASRLVPGTPEVHGRALTVAQFMATNNDLPTLTDLTESWNAVVGADRQMFEVASGIAFLATNEIFDVAGGGSSLHILRRAATGDGFVPALMGETGFSLERLTGEYMSLIPTP